MKNRLFDLSKKTRFALLNAVLSPILALGLIQFAYAQDAEKQAELQLQQIREQMKAAGLDPDQIDGAGGFVMGTMQRAADLESAERAEDVREFEANNAGFGKAVVSVDGKVYDMQITKCDTEQGGNYAFNIEAQTGPEKRDGTLSVVHDSHYKRVVVHLSNRDGSWETYIQSQMPQLKNQRLEWTGKVDGGRGRAELALSLNCMATS